MVTLGQCTRCKGTGIEPLTLICCRCRLTIDTDRDGELRFTELGEPIHSRCREPLAQTFRCYVCERECEGVPEHDWDEPDGRTSASCCPCWKTAGGTCDHDEAERIAEQDANAEAEERRRTAAKLP